MMLGFSQVAGTFVSMVRNKLLAIFLGTAGIGLFSQLQKLQELAANSVPMGMQVGATKYFAQCRATDRASLPSYVSTAYKAFLVLSVVATAACLFFVKPLAAWSVGDRGLFLYLIPPIVGVPFLIQVKVWQSYLQAGLEMKALAESLVATSAAGLIVAVPLVYFYGNLGAAIHLLVIAVIGYAIVRMYAGRSMAAEFRSEMKTAKFDFKVLRNLLRFGAANIPGFTLWLIVPFLVRVQIIKDLGLGANGIFQAAFAISNQQMGVLVSALGTYALPKFSQLSDRAEMNDEVDKNLRVALLLNTPIILFVLLAADVVIRVLYSAKFMPAVALFPWMMIGTFSRFVTYAIAAPILPLERFRARNIMCVLQYCIFLAVFYATPPQSRLYGAAVAEAVSWSFALVTMYFYMRWLNGYRFDRGNWRLLLTSAAAVVTVAILPFPELKWRLVGSGVAVLWAATACSAEERAKLIGSVKERLSRPTTSSGPDDPA